MRVSRFVNASLLSTLRKRGFVASETHPEETETVLSKPTKVYAGYDPTADGLHVGSLVSLLALAHFQRAGHTPVVLIGGATGLIGDPSGRSTERQMLAEEDLSNNAAGITRDALAVLSNACDPKGPHPIVVNNADWWNDISSLGLLRDIGRHFRVPTMLRRESVSKRLESAEGISFTEFSYQLLQSHDFYHLQKTMGVCVQLGGSDQWGNIVAGIDYSRRRGVLDRMAGLCVPLISTKDGQKLGKSAGNAIWLNEKKTSNLDLYQYFVQNATDESCGVWMKLLTMMDIEELDRLSNLGGGSSQKELAYRVVELVRGVDAAEEAKKASIALFEGSGSTENVQVCSQELTLAEILVRFGLAPSKAEARRLVEQGGVFVSEERQTDAFAKLKAHIGNVVMLRAGKKKRVAIKIQ